MSIEKVVALYQDYHWEGELRMLNRLADGVHEGVIVAIGSYRGQMDCALALHAHVPVYCIDPRDAPGTHYGDVDRPYWMLNVLALGVAEKVRPINLSSHLASKVLDSPIGLLFIDGDHSFDSVYSDLQDWLPHMLEGGLVALHDSNMADVIRATERWHQYLDLVEVSDVTSVYRYVPSGDVYSGGWDEIEKMQQQDFADTIGKIYASKNPEGAELVTGSVDAGTVEIDLDEIDQLVNDEIKSDPLDTPVLRPDELSTKRKKKGSK